MIPWEYINIKVHLRRATSNEVFKVVEVLPTNPTTYNIADGDGEIIKGGFYEQELLKSEMTHSSLL